MTSKTQGKSPAIAEATAKKNDVDSPAPLVETQVKITAPPDNKGVNAHFYEPRNPNKYSWDKWHNGQVDD